MASSSLSSRSPAPVRDAQSPMFARDVASPISVRDVVSPALTDFSSVDTVSYEHHIRLRSYSDGSRISKLGWKA